MNTYKRLKMPPDFNLLCDDALKIIYNQANIKCHVCHKKFSFTTLFYKKNGKFYFCSQECYNFI